MILPDLTTQAELARMVGVSRPRVTALKRVGRLVLADDGAVRTVDTLRLLRKTADPSRESKMLARIDALLGAHDAAIGAADPAETEIDPIGNSYQTARSIKEKYLALTAKRDYELACGKLMESERVEQAFADILVTVRSRIESWPVTAGPLVAAESDEQRCVALLREQSETCLREMIERVARLRETLRGAP